MLFLDRYPTIVTEHFRASADFWTRHLGFAVIFEDEWFVCLQAEGASASIALMSPAHPSSLPGLEPFAAGISMEIADAAAALAELRARGREPAYPLTDGAFGQRRFGLKYPSGLWVTIVQQLG